MYSCLRSLLFKLDPERAHHLALSLLRYFPGDFCPKTSFPSNPIHAMGLQFPHEVGLAAGLDKNGDYLDALAKLGFSFIEIGTVTPRPQGGNPKPRLFRVPEAEALINRMGFNNQGVDALVSAISKANYQGILGINIGKNKDTPLRDATEDYLHCLRKVYCKASYVTINISSPNTPDLRQLQGTDYFESLMHHLKQEQLHLSDQYKRYVPLVIKLSPDESNESLQRMAETILECSIDGIIATNTTSNREAVQHYANGQQEGGLSGQPLFARSTECLRVIKEIVGDSVTLIGVGGIHHTAAASEKLQAGAHLVQVYTGLIYQGPSLVRALVDGLAYHRAHLR